MEDPSAISRISDPEAGGIYTKELTVSMQEALFYTHAPPSPPCGRRIKTLLRVSAYIVSSGSPVVAISGFGSPCIVHGWRPLWSERSPPLRATNTALPSRNCTLQWATFAVGLSWMSWILALILQFPHRQSSLQMTGNPLKLQLRNWHWQCLKNFQAHYVHYQELSVDDTLTSFSARTYVHANQVGCKDVIVFWLTPWYL